jgi:hypothetical protein
MTTLTIKLPEKLTTELKDRHIADEAVHEFVVRAIEFWLQSDVSPEAEQSPNARSSPFSESAVPYIDKLIAENRSLFERLARLPDLD